MCNVSNSHIALNKKLERMSVFTTILFGSLVMDMSTLTRVCLIIILCLP